jgi:lactam utilization protein B
MARTLLFFLFILFAMDALSQTQQQKQKKMLGIIMGNVLESKTGKAVPFASVSVQIMGDTAKTANTITDKNGSFEFQQLPLG